MFSFAPNGHSLYITDALELLNYMNRKCQKKKTKTNKKKTLIKIHEINIQTLKTIFISKVILHFTKENCVFQVIFHQ